MLGVTDDRVNPSVGARVPLIALLPVLLRGTTEGVTTISNVHRPHNTYGRMGCRVSQGIKELFTCLADMQQVDKLRG